MRSKWRFGAQLANTFSGRGHPSSGLGPGPECKYVYTGDPADTNAWSECVCSHNPGDRRFILSSNDFTLSAAEQKKVVMALVVDSMAGGCPSVNFTGIREVADTAWYVYHNPLPPILTPMVEKRGTVSIYPNPVRDKLHIDWDAGGGEMSISIYNPVGQCLGTQICNRAANSVDVTGYPPGAYLLLYRDTGITGKVVFLKK